MTSSSLPIPQNATSSKARRPERDVLREVERYLKLASIIAIRMNTGALRNEKGRPVFFGYPGMADLLALPWVEKRFDFPSVPRATVEGWPNSAVRSWICQPVWIECKSSSGRHSNAQKVFQQIVESYGHTYLLVRSVAEVAEWLKRHSARARA